MINIRPITKPELPQFSRLVHSLISSEFPNYSEKIIDYFLTKDLTPEILFKQDQAQERLFWAAFDDNQMVSFLISLRVYGGVCLIIWLGVQPQFQHQGIGRMILDQFGQWVVSKGGHALHLWTSHKNIKFYQKCGFKKIGKVEKSYFGTDDYLMVKILRTPKEENFLKS